MKLTFRDLVTGLLSTSELNNNFSDIESELQNKVLYRDNPSGEPNAMQHDLDMNGYNIVNAGANSTGLASASLVMSVSFTDVGTLTYTLTTTDIYRLLEVNTTATANIFVKTEADAGWAAGQKVSLVQVGAGQILINPDTSVSFRFSETLLSRTQFSVLELVYKGSDVWYAYGDMEPS